MRRMPVAQQYRLWRNSARIRIWNYSIIAIIFQQQALRRFVLAVTQP